MNGRFLITIGEHTPAILCEKHAKTFEQTMIAGNVPHTIYEMDEDDEHYNCHACKMAEAKEEASRPHIILPGEF